MKMTFQVFRLSHVVLVIIGICTFWYLQKLLERLHMKVQKSNKKAILKSKLKVMKVLNYDSHKTTSFIRIKLWKLFKECHFFHKRMDVSRKTTTFCGKNMWWVIKASSKGRCFVTFLPCFLTFEDQRGDFFEILLHKWIKKLK